MAGLVPAIQRAGLDRRDAARPAMTFKLSQVHELTLNVMAGLVPAIQRSAWIAGTLRARR
jgi:hypothetical protein